MIPAISTDTWVQTALWQRLESRDEDVKAALRRWMPDIESILRQGGSTPETYTLHDNEHSFRVAGWMVQIIPTDVLEALSSYELALLLLSAYLHDIGMTPKGAKVRAIETFLASSTDKAEGPAVKPFREWAAANMSGITFPLDPGMPPEKRVELVHELTARYVREKHNEWSAELIRERPMGREPLGTYPGWVEDLVRLCQSHHWCFDDLKSNDFRPRRVGTPPATVHLRYLAAVLRIADILDVDPRRTPEAVERHRVIDASSRVFWEKDRGLSLEISENRVIASAVPPNATIHWAVTRTLDQMDIELRLCRRLAEDTPFESFPPFGKLKHRWDLHSSVLRDIRTPDTYVCIDGRFRPDERRMLQLLSSSGFHSDPLSAVVELVTNALDAVEEQMAYERLETGEAKLHSVRLRLQQEDGRDWLVCIDDGAGLTRDLIENRVLVSGSVRSDIRILDYRCRSKGFSLARTGSFGLGLLSYFSIADRLEIRTQRSPEAMKVSQCDTGGLRILEAWQFQTDGTDAIGELVQYPTASVGAEVRLLLKPDVAVRGEHGLISQISAFLNDRLLQPPCEFVFDAGDGREQLPFHPVAPPRPDLPSQIREEITGRAKISGWEITAEHAQDLSAELGKKLCWREEKGDLPSGLGRYRIELPYFELAGGACLAFMRAVEKGGEIVLDPIHRGATSRAESFAFSPGLNLTTTWNGIYVRATPPPTIEPNRRANVTIDWRASEAGHVTRRRQVLALTEAGSQSAQWVQERAATLIGAFLNDGRDSVYATLNAHLAGEPLVGCKRMHWISPAAVWDAEKKEMSYPAGLTRTWRPLPMPAVMGVFAPPRRWMGLEVSTTARLEMPRGLFGSLSWDPRIVCPDRVVFVPAAEPGRFGYLTPLWTGEQSGTISGIGPTALFPPTWRQFIGVEEIWNREHPIVQAMSGEDLHWCRQHRQAINDPTAYRQELLEKPGRAAAWLAVVEKSRAFWRDHAAFLGEVWTLLLNSQEPVAFLYGTHLLLVSPTEVRDIDVSDQPLDQVLGDPGEEWKLM